MLKLFAQIIVLILNWAQRQRVLPGPRAPQLPEPDRLQTVCEKLGLTLSGNVGLGRVDGRAVRVEVSPERQDRVVVRADVPTWMTILPRAESSPTAEECPTYDRFFDERYAVGGEPFAAAALLDAKVRSMLQSAGWVRLHQSRLTVEVQDELADSLLRACRLLVTAANRMSAPTAHSARLRRIANDDTNNFVRKRAMELLVKRRPHDDETLRALWLGIDDPFTPAALFAATHVGPAAAPHLRYLVQLAASADRDRLAGIQVLLANDAPDEVRALLTSAARGFPSSVSKQSMRWLFERFGVAGLREILEKPEETASENLEQAFRLVAKHTAQEGRKQLAPDLEQAILVILLGDLPRLAAARVAAATILGRLGTRASVPPLREVARRQSASDAAVARAARKAADQISGREKGLSGGLSVVPGDAGELSIPDVSSGALSTLSED